jgi:hypothetical protein
MERGHRRGYRGLILAIVALLVVLIAAGCSHLSGTDTTAGVVTTAGGVTTLPPGDTTTTPGVATTTTMAPVTTLAPTTTLPPATTATTEKLSSAEERLASGHIKATGLIDDVWVSGGVRHLRIDYVDVITDHAAATAAARAAGEIGPTEEWDLDYYISNTNPLMREFVVSNSAAIFTTFRNHLVDLSGVPCTWTDFLGFWGPGPIAEGDAHLPTALWTIERDGSTVVRIFQEYFP